MAAVGVSFWVAGTTVTEREVDGKAGVEVDMMQLLEQFLGVVCFLSITIASCLQLAELIHIRNVCVT